MSGRGDNNKKGSSGRGSGNQSNQAFAGSENVRKSNHGYQTGGRRSQPQSKEMDNSSNRDQSTNKKANNIVNLGEALEGVPSYFIFMKRCFRN